MSVIPCQEPEWHRDVKFPCQKQQHTTNTINPTFLPSVRNSEAVVVAERQSPIKLILRRLMIGQ